MYELIVRFAQRTKCLEYLPVQGRNGITQSKNIVILAIISLQFQFQFLKEEQKQFKR